MVEVENRAEGFQVKLKIYDISRGMARSMSGMILGKQIDGIWHTGVVVYGLEYFYGGGIVSGAPEDVERNYDLAPVDVIELGITHIPQDVFHNYLDGIRDQFTLNTYDLLNWNCNNFTDEVSKFLIGDGIPKHIIELPKEALNTPLGKIVLPMIQAAQQGYQQEMANSGQRSLWTQGTSGSSDASLPTTNINDTNTTNNPASSNNNNTSSNILGSNAYEDEAKRLTDMGFPDIDKNRRALVSSSGSVEAAIEVLLKWG